MSFGQIRVCDKGARGPLLFAVYLSDLDEFLMVKQAGRTTIGQKSDIH